MIETPTAEIIIAKLSLTDEPGQMQRLHLPDDFDWLRHFETHHIAQFFRELFEALQQSSETGDWTGITEVIEDWKATAEIEASPELRQTIADGVEQLASGEAIHWAKLSQELGL